MAAPPVTVVIPAYQAEATLGAALASIRDQDFADHQVLVIDAGSSDRTVDVARACAADDSRIVVVDPGVRLNAPQARNVALSRVESPLIAMLDSDDLMLPGRLSAQVSRMAHPDLVAVAGRLQVIDAAGVPIAVRSEGPVVVPTPMGVRYFMAFACPTLSSGMAYRTAALRRVGGFVEGRQYADDYAVLWSLMRVGECAQIADYVAQYRIHGAQISQRHRPRQRIELASMCRIVAEDVIGGPVAWTSVLAWIGFQGAMSGEQWDLAFEELEAYDAAFRKRYSPTGDDDASIRRRFDEVRGAVEARRDGRALRTTM